jgi:replicative DNA helicase
MAVAQPVARSDAPDPQLVALKLPPHSVEAEQSLLGALLIDNQAFDRVADLVVAEDFYRDDHRRIWRHIARLVEATRPADVVTVSESMEASEDKDKTGGAAYLAALAQNTPSALNVRRYAELVRERSVQRRLAQVATEIAESALAPTGKDVGLLLDEAESRIFQIAESGARKDQGLLEIKPVLAQVFEKIDHLYHRDNPSNVTGVPTGYIKLDDMTSGLQGGDLIIIAGRPSMGKTALALNIAEHVAVDNGLPVAVFSMEMSASQVATRMLGSIARVDQHKMRTGQAARDAHLHRRRWRADCPGNPRASPAPQAPVLQAGARRHRLPAAHVRDWPGREPRHGNLRDLALAQGHGEGVGCAGHRALAAESSAGATPEQAAANGRPAGIRGDRAGCGCDSCDLPG